MLSGPEEDGDLEDGDEEEGAEDDEDMGKYYRTPRQKYISSCRIGMGLKGAQAIFIWRGCFYKARVNLLPQGRPHVFELAILVHHPHIAIVVFQSEHPG